MLKCRNAPIRGIWNRSGPRAMDPCGFGSISYWTLRHVFWVFSTFLGLLRIRPRIRVRIRCIPTQMHLPHTVANALFESLLVAGLKSEMRLTLQPPKMIWNHLRIIDLLGSTCYRQSKESKNRLKTLVTYVKTTKKINEVRFLLCIVFLAT